MMPPHVQREIFIKIMDASDGVGHVWPVRVQ